MNLIYNHKEVEGRALFIETETIKKPKNRNPVYSFLGSSVTEGSANCGISFVEYLADSNDCICIKEAVSGTTLTNIGSDSYVQRLRDRIEKTAVIDHFICQLSTNDVGLENQMGMISNSKHLKDFDTSTIIGAMEFIIAYVCHTFNCPITFFTNPCFHNPIYEKMIDTLYKLQTKWDVGILDFYQYKDMDVLPKSVLDTFMADPIHPNANGYKWMACEMRKYLSKFL